MTRFIIADTETTGLGPTYKDPHAPPKQACEVALMEIDPDTFEVIGEMDSIINPQCDIHPAAVEVHGITQKQADAAPTLAQYIQDTLGGPLDGEIVLVGYRVAFDLPLLRPFGNIVKTFDLLPLAQNLVQDSENHKLQTLKEYFNLPGGAAHRAIGDVHTTYQLLKTLIPMTGRSLRMHCATEFQIYQRAPWGKHAGELIINLPASYKRWLLTLPDLEPNLRRSIELYQATDRQI